MRNLKSLDFRPYKQQESKEEEHWAIGNINYIYKGIALAHALLDFGSVKYAWYPEDDAYSQSEKHQHYAGNSDNHVIFIFSVVFSNYLLQVFLPFQAIKYFKQKIEIEDSFKK